MKVIFSPQVSNVNGIEVPEPRFPCGVDVCGYYCISKCGTLQHNCSRGVVGYSEQNINKNR